MNVIFIGITFANAPSSSLTNPNVGPKVKQQKKKKVRACSLTNNTFRVRGHVETLEWDHNKLTSNSLKWNQLAQPRK